MKKKQQKCPYHETPHADPRCELHALGAFVLGTARCVEPNFGVVTIVVEDLQHMALVVDGPGLSMERTAEVLEVLAARVRAKQQYPFRAVDGVFAPAAADDPSPECETWIHDSSERK